MAVLEKRDIFDIIIVGGGLAGLSLANLLAAQSFSVACVDISDPERAMTTGFDGRTTAISWASRKILEAANIWDSLTAYANPIDEIQIMDGDSPTLLTFDKEEVDNRNFGWIIENHLIRKALYKQAESIENLTLFAPDSVQDFSVSEKFAKAILKNGRTLQASLIIGADGRNSFTREWMGISTRGWSYKQQAIVCNVVHENPHNNIAIENFREQGPFAVLPMTNNEQGRNRSSVVWTEHAVNKNSSALNYDDTVFNAALNARFPDFYGGVELTGQRFSFPLGLKHAHNYIAPRMALVAEAAHAMHPIAGQGLNMGFRDIAKLADLLIAAREDGVDLGSNELLHSYQSARRMDNMGMMAATDGLNKLFGSRLPGIGMARLLGVRVVSRFTPAKQFFMKQAMGAAGVLPQLLKDAS